MASPLDELLDAPLWRWGEAGGPPRVPGAYAWFSDAIPPSLPADGLYLREGRRLLYVGIAPRASGGAGRDSLRTSLQPRIAYHYDGDAGASALRMTLGVVLAESLGLSLGLHPDGERFLWEEPGERALSGWMQIHLRVSWVEHVRPWEVSDMAFRSLVLPLNLQAQDPTPVQRELAARQAALQAQARAGIDKV